MLDQEVADVLGSGWGSPGGNGLGVIEGVGRRVGESTLMNAYVRRLVHEHEFGYDVFVKT